jgi:glycosyltransferase involved in cell wall biosynthesis
MSLTVLAERIQPDNPHRIDFDYREVPLRSQPFERTLGELDPCAVIFWTNPRAWLFRYMLRARRRGVKLIHWGHRRDLQQRMPWLKHAVYDLEHCLDDAIIVYSPALKARLPSAFQAKTFVANNTVDLSGFDVTSVDRAAVRARYGIRASKVIVCLGRLQRRKRIDDLLRAYAALAMEDVALVLAGPDSDGLLANVDRPNIHKTGPVYGKEALELLTASDVYCLPGAIGLSIVDAFYCGLPVVTERVNHGPEFMYFREGINGLSVDKGDVAGLAEKLRLLLTREDVRQQYSHAARAEILANGTVDRMCEGFVQALDHVFAGAGARA